MIRLLNCLSIAKPCPQAANSLRLPRHGDGEPHGNPFFQLLRAYLEAYLPRPGSTGKPLNLVLRSDPGFYIPKVSHLTSPK
jgi:hypothetical protein